MYTNLESTLPTGNADVLNICRPEWAETVIAADHSLLGLLPCVVSVIERGENTIVSTATPTLLGSIAPTPDIQKLSEEAEASLRALVETACGVDPLKAKQLKLYASHSCPYCKMEANWLEQKKVDFEMVYIDDDPKAAEDLVKRTGQMGVPVTEAVFDQDHSEFIVGFDRAKLDTIINAM